MRWKNCICDSKHVPEYHITCKMGGHHGKIFENMKGVLQGGVLSPNLFKLFLEDITDYLNTGKGVHIGGMKIPYLLYTEDLVFMSESPPGLQYLIRGLENFCTHWHIVVNLTKTKVVVFNERFVNGDNSSFYFNNKKIPVSNYLGVIFSNANDRFYDDYENKRGKAFRAIYTARSLAHGVIGPDISPTILFKIFYTQIKLIIDYGSEIFYDRKPKPRVESLQTTYFKRALGVRVQTSNLAILRESGRYPLIARQEKLTLGY